MGEIVYLNGEPIGVGTARGEITWKIGAIPAPEFADWLKELSSASTSFVVGPYGAALGGFQPLPPPTTLMRCRKCQRITANLGEDGLLHADFIALNSPDLNYCSPCYIEELCL